MRKKEDKSKAVAMYGHSANLCGCLFCLIFAQLFGIPCS